MSGDIREWLEGLGLGQYAEAFAENGVDLDLLPDVTNDDLKDLGVTRLADRKRILKAIAGPETVTDDSRPSGRTAETREAERRQLTVMFCDLVGSTELSGRLDPEDLRQVLRAYRQACADAVGRFEGHIAKYIGDGLLVYFGYPQAHEDDARRAVSAGLSIVDGLGRLNPRLTAEHGVELAVRIGVHTGLVVAGEMGGGETREAGAIVGETPNVAARLEALAAPDTVVISAATHRLVDGLFDCNDLGPQELKGIAEAVKVYRVRGKSAAPSRFEAAAARGLTPLIGRDEEIDLLVKRWEQTKDGEGQVVLLSGEAGIGKSRIVRGFRDRLEGEPHNRVLYFCSAYHQNSALHPVIDQLERALRFAPEDSTDQKLDKIEATLEGLGLAAAEAVPLVAALLDLPVAERYPALEASPQQLKAKTLDVLISVVEAMAAEDPVLMVVEDAHLMDPSTRELLDLLIERLRSTRVQLILNVRPEFEPPWTGLPQVTLLALNRLSRRDAAAVIAKVTGGKDVPDVVVDEILAKTDGIPLFVEELTKTVLESGILEDPDLGRDSGGALPTLAIPTSLQDSLMARLDRLAPVKEIAQLGATIGRAFGHELLAAVSPLREAALEEALARLADAELIYRRGRPPTASYEFKHAMVQDVAYQSLLKSTRQQYHKAIAQALEERFPETANSQPELVAQHYTEAGLAEQAVPLWHRAGRRDLERSANHEAVAHCTKALELVGEMRESPERRQQELALLLVLGPALMPTKGFGSNEVRDTYDRARDLSERIDETEPLFPATWGLWQSRQARGETDAACEIADELLEIAERQADTALLLQAHHSAWTSRFARDELRSVHTHAERGLALYDFAAHRGHAFDYGGHDPGVCCRVIGGMTSCFLGQPDRARDLVIDAAALADRLGHPFSTALAHSFSATVYLFRREPRMVRCQADALAVICSEHGFPFFRPMEPILRGWALAADGEVSEGVATIQEGLDAIRAGGVNRRLSFQLALLAEACARAGETERGLEALSEAESVIEATGEHRWEAEVHRLKGEMLATRAPSDLDDAEAHLRRALDIARRQEAKWFELRAATSLARLWSAQDKRVEARDMLAPVFGWFSEGFDTPDLMDAKALLDELA